MTATVGAPPDEVLPEADTAFHVEQHGIDFIPTGERWARPRDLFGMWAGASVQIEYFVYGAILMTFGFTFTQAVVLIVIGAVLLLQTLGIFEDEWIGRAWPLIIIGVGVWLLYRKTRGGLQ